MRKLKRFLSVAFALAVPAALCAKVKLPFCIGDGMVIQQNTRALLWGEAKAHSAIKVTVSWSKDTYRATADDKGHFELRVKTPAASYTPLSITFDDGERLTLRDVLAGDVWICGGQSNMEMPVHGFASCPVEGFNETVAESPKTADKIRFLMVDKRQSFTPIPGSGKHWLKTDPEHVIYSSAAGYFFARRVNSVADVPIGLIEANMGGTAIQCWLNDTTLRSLVPDIDLSPDAIKGIRSPYSPTTWYNGTFYPIHRYSCRGILFYQGCTNCDSPDVYRMRYADFLAAMVKLWRKGFGEGDIPFYYVQIAPYGNESKDLARAFIRDQQLKALKLIPNSGLVCTTDLVYPDERRQIHPRNKRAVGDRLAYLALTRTYGVKGFYAESAQLREVKISHDTVHVFLDNDYQAIMPTNPAGFELAGADRVFHPAKADALTYPYKTQGIILTCPEVKEPVAVRYNYHDYAVAGNAKNAGGLPLFPFRTDDW